MVTEVHLRSNKITNVGVSFNSKENMYNYTNRKIQCDNYIPTPLIIFTLKHS